MRVRFLLAGIIDILTKTLRLYRLRQHGAHSSIRHNPPYRWQSRGRSSHLCLRSLSVATNFYTLHRNTAVFGEDVEVFDAHRWNRIEPERWESMDFSGKCGARIRLWSKLRML